MNVALFLAMAGRKRDLVTETFNADATWVAPASVSSLASVVGHGVNGTAGTTTARSATCVSVVYGGTGWANSGYVLWSEANGSAQSAKSTLDGSVDGSFSKVTVFQGTDNTYATTSNPVSFSNASSGGTLSYGGSWAYSGSINASGSATVSWTQTTPGSAGAAATGFSYSFAGGAAGAVAPSATYNNVAVTPGASYNVVVPTGATIQISYYL